jgi:hypothetical protein
MEPDALKDFLLMRLNISDQIRFFRNYLQFVNQRKNSSHEFTFGKLHPCLRDWHDLSGTASGHYFHQDLLVAQKIYAENPVKHVDVGSRIDGFVAHVAAFRQVEVFDVRPLQSPHPNIIFVQADFMGDCTKLAHYCDSLSCLHALEHFGLGRYGDVVDFEGHLKGFRNLVSILKIGGTLYFSVPIGPQRVEFNAHRIFDLPYLMRLFEKQFRVDTFSYVDDVGDLHQDAPTSGNSFENSFACSYGCGIFELTKIAE